MNASRRPIVIWLLTGCVLVAVMVVVGGITRLTHSGLSMVEWSLIMGAVPPLNEEQWIEAFEKYKQFPEYQVMHYYFTLEDFKSIFMWEYVHRLLGRLIGLVFLIPFAFFWMKGNVPKSLMPKLIVIFIWGGFQGFLGWYMVKSGLVNNPNVSHYRLAIHLVTAFGLCAYIFWVARSWMTTDRKFSFSLKNWPEWLMIDLILLQIIYGAFVAGLKAGFIHTTWPKMDNDWMAPSISTAIGESGLMALIEDPVTVQFVHRWLAFLVLGFVLVIVFRVKSMSGTAVPKARNMLLIVLGVQIVLGIITLIMAVPLTFAVLHQLVALLLLMAGVNYLFERSYITKPAE